MNSDLQKYFKIYRKVMDKEVIKYYQNSFLSIIKYQKIKTKNNRYFFQNKEMELPSNKKQSQIKLEVHSDLKKIQYGVISEFFNKLHKKKPHLLIESCQYLIEKNGGDSEWIVLKAYDTNLKIFKTLKVQCMEFCQFSYRKYAKILKQLYPIIINEMNTDLTVKIYNFYILNACGNGSLPLYFVIESELIHNTLSRFNETVDSYTDLQQQSLHYINQKFNFSCSPLDNSSYEIIAGSDNQYCLKLNPLKLQILERLYYNSLDQGSIEIIIKEQLNKCEEEENSSCNESSESLNEEENRNNDQQEDIQINNQDDEEEEEEESNNNESEEEQEDNEDENDTDDDDNIQEEIINDDSENIDSIQQSDEEEEEEEEEEDNDDEDDTNTDDIIEEDIINNNSENIDSIQDKMVEENKSEGETQKLKLKQTNYVVMNKENLVTTLNELYPKLIERHDSQIFEIISQHPKYHEFILYDYDENTFVFKLMYEEKKHYLKCEKYSSILQAEQTYKHCMLLKCRKLFKPTVELEIVPLESSTYLLYLEEDLDDQIYFVSNFNSQLKNTPLGLSIATWFLDELEQIEFEWLQFSNILQLRLEITKTPDNEYRFYFSNPFFKLKRQLESTNINQFVGDNVRLFTSLNTNFDLERHSDLQEELEQYLIRKLSNHDIHISSFPLLFGVYRQQKRISPIIKMFPKIKINIQNFQTIRLSFNNEMMKLTDDQFQQIFDKDYFNLYLSFGELDSILGKLSKPSNINEIEISIFGKPVNNANKNNMHKLTEYFPHLQQLYLDLNESNILDIETIEFNQLIQLKKIKISFRILTFEKNYKGKGIDKRIGSLSKLITVFTNKHFEYIHFSSYYLFSFLRQIDVSFFGQLKEKSISKVLVNEYKSIQYFFGYINKEEYEEEYEEIGQSSMLEGYCSTHKTLLQLEDRERVNSQIEEKQISESNDSRKDDQDFEYSSKSSLIEDLSQSEDESNEGAVESEDEEEAEIQEEQKFIISEHSHSDDSQGDKEKEEEVEEEIELEEKCLTKSEQELEDQYEYQSKHYSSSNEDEDEEERKLDNQTTQYQKLISQIQLIVNEFDYLSCKVMCRTENELKTLNIRFERYCDGSKHHVQIELQRVNGVISIVKVQRHDNQSIFFTCRDEIPFQQSNYTLNDIVNCWLRKEVALSYFQQIFGYEESCGCFRLDELNILRQYYCDQLHLKSLAIHFNTCKCIEEQLKINPDFYGLSQLQNLTELSILLQHREQDMILFCKNAIKNNPKLNTIIIKGIFGRHQYYIKRKQKIQVVFWKSPRLVSLQCCWEL